MHCPHSHSELSEACLDTIKDTLAINISGIMKVLEETHLFHLPSLVLAEFCCI